MKYTIVFGFFVKILAVAAILSGNSGFYRIKQPAEWVRAGLFCLQGVPSDLIENFGSYNKTTATRAAKCLALCYYTESRQLVDGVFDPVAIEVFLRAHIGFHHLLERVVTIFKAAAHAGNTEPGEISDKAYAYHTMLGTPENKRILNAVFRPFTDSM